MKYRKMILVCIVLSSLMSDRAVAQGPPINTETAFVTGLNGAAFRTFVQTVRKSKLLKDGSEIADPMNREVQVIVVPFVFPYELISNKLVVGAGVPFFDKSMNLTQNNARQQLSNSGLGDVSLFAKYQLMQRDSHNKTSRVTFKGTVKLPTADNKKRDGSGNSLPPGMQLGSGSLDYSAGLIFTHSVGKLGINADATYRLNTEADGFEAGDSFNYNLALGYRIYPAVYETYPSPYATVYLEGNGQFSQKSKTHGAIADDSGGHIFYLSPGIQFIPFGSLILEATVQIPIFQELNGTQLGTDFVLKTGIRWLIF